MRNLIFFPILILSILAVLYGIYLAPTWVQWVIGGWVGFGFAYGGMHSGDEDD